jgi:hypothetical protein
MEEMMKYRGMNYSGSPPTAAERAIARRLGVTPAGLHTLLRIKRGDGVSGGTAGEKLEKQGLVTPWSRDSGSGTYMHRCLTPEGERLLAEARALGY